MGRWKNPIPSVEPGDPRTLRGVFSSIERWSDASTATSAALPPNPTIGDTCYVTDTGQLVVWYGDSTQWKPPWSLPWGLLVSASSSTNSTFTSTGSVLTGLSGTYSFLAGRSYQLNLTGRVSNNTAGTVSTLRLRINGGNQMVFNMDHRAANQDLGFTVSYLHQPLGSGSAALDVFATATAGTSSAAFSVTPGRLWVTDVGPLTSTPPTT